ncbi:drug/metabolite transporter (DMT)-like permease [Anaerosolibacter carboniphilus]|uniref:Drug/metabolite transporter (DMT)-like permease n=1 Tax=Anaerosolibacter carboniphilus TaxID=1417629 RepID=A0A841KWP8_9FIRM|nr:DMT family transporter [Anaerosolibacter carboniphilus]MBB6217787.1 drug/metabolite transporter (DMT)-like permease [Anaerosolibacter carboniphilus]
MKTEANQYNIRVQAIIYLIVASLLWSLGGFFIKWVQWNPVAIAGTRSAISAMLIWGVLRKPKFVWSKEQILCAVFYAGTVISFVIANKLTTAANAILLQYTAPIYVAVFGFVVLKEKTTKLDWVVIGVIIAGMILFFIDDFEMKNVLGNIIAIISGITFAATVLLMRKQKNESPLESILLGNILTAMIGVPFMFQSAPSSSSWIGLILLGTIQLGLPYILYAKAIKSVTALEAVLIPVIEPIVNPIWVFLLLGEVPGRWSILGGIIVVIAVTLRCVIGISKTQVGEQLANTEQSL